MAGKSAQFTKNARAELIVRVLSHCPLWNEAMRMATDESGPRSVHDRSAAPFADSTSDGVLDPVGAGDVRATGAPMALFGAEVSLHAAMNRQAATIDVPRARTAILEAVMMSEAGEDDWS
jgi:hypothetical protein